GIVYSKDQRQPDTTRPRAGGNGVTGDHWHAALGFDICGTFAPNISDQTDVSGIHTHGDGVVHVHPFSAVSAGKRATLNVFFTTVKAKVSSSEISLPGLPTKKDGQKCGDAPAVVQVKTWPDRKPDTAGTIVAGNPSDIHPKDGELITIAFAPKGQDIPRPPSADQLDKLSDLGTQSPTTAPGDTTPSSATPSSTAPGDTAPASTTPGSTEVPANGAPTSAAPTSGAPTTTPAAPPSTAGTGVP
ncbi:MAG: hypothetical protein ABR511_09740, partial [Acidimicrobiales bacterium]